MKAISKEQSGPITYNITPFFPPAQLTRARSQQEWDSSNALRKHLRKVSFFLASSLSLYPKHIHLCRT
jgi:hypothetical protein